MRIPVTVHGLRNSCPFPSPTSQSLGYFVQEPAPQSPALPARALLLLSLWILAAGTRSVAPGHLPAAGIRRLLLVQQAAAACSSGVEPAAASRFPSDSISAVVASAAAVSSSVRISAGCGQLQIKISECSAGSTGIQRPLQDLHRKLIMSACYRSPPTRFLCQRSPITAFTGRMAEPNEHEVFGGFCEQTRKSFDTFLHPDDDVACPASLTSLRHQSKDIVSPLLHAFHLHVSGSNGGDRRI